MPRRIRLKAVAATMLLAVTATVSCRAESREASTASPLGHAIVFTRFLPGADTGSVYRIDAGNTANT